jgi:hypothetical protein
MRYCRRLSSIGGDVYALLPVTTGQYSAAIDSRRQGGAGHQARRGGLIHMGLEEVPQGMELCA